MKIALLQLDPIVGDFAGNVERIEQAVARASEAGAELAVCSELALMGYPPRDLLERPAFVDANLRALDELAAGVAIPTVVGFVDRVPSDDSGRGLRNAAALVADGAIQSVHHKVLLPTYDVFDEWRYFEPGGEVAVAEVGGVKLGISICEDIWNDANFWPRRQYRRDPIEELVTAGAQILVNISASPFTVHKRTVRQQMLVAQASKHGRPLVMVNQVGGNDDLVFDGRSLAIAPNGEIVAAARELDEDLVVVDVDPETGAIAGGVVSPTQSDSAAALAALVLGTRDYVHKCGFQRVLIGLSGGIDSAITAAIAVRALGADNVLGVSMPSRYSSQHSKDDARDLADALGIEMLSIPIEGIFASGLEALAPAFAGREPDVAEENIQARARAIVLMALSNKLGNMLLTTGNKSEVAVGYCTLYGDMSGGLAVISDVPKTMVYELSEEVNRQAGRDVIPRSTIDKPPSAELRPDQTDQDSLPPYDVLDAILEMYVEEHRSAADIIEAGFDADTVRHVVGLVRRSEYKRNQAAPGLKIRGKTFGPGRRMPLAARWTEP